MNREYPQPQLDLDGLSKFLDEAFPPEARAGLGSVVEIVPGRVRMLLEPTPAMASPVKSCPAHRSWLWRTWQPTP